MAMDGVAKPVHDNKNNNNNNHSQRYRRKKNVKIKNKNYVMHAHDSNILDLYPQLQPTSCSPAPNAPTMYTRTQSTRFDSANAPSHSAQIHLSSPARARCELGHGGPRVRGVGEAVAGIIETGRDTRSRAEYGIGRRCGCRMGGGGLLVGLVSVEVKGVRGCDWWGSTHPCDCP